MQLFYTTDIRDDQVVLHDQEAQHCMKVLRHHVGDDISVIDGCGTVYQTRIVTHDKRTVTCSILDRVVHPAEQRSPNLAFGMIKNTTRLEWMIEKVTEIGVNTIQPLICQRSEKRRLKEERLQKIILSAAKQSKQYHFPILKPAMKYNDYMAQSIIGTGYVAHYIPDQSDIWEVVDRSSSSTFLIGPEGDFTDEEVQLAIAKGYVPVNLGSSRLRAETAAMVACTHLNT